VYYYFEIFYSRIFVEIRQVTCLLLRVP